MILEFFSLIRAICETKRLNRRRKRKKENMNFRIEERIMFERE